MSAPDFAQARLRPSRTSPRPAPDMDASDKDAPDMDASAKDASGPRSRHRRAARYRQLRPGAYAIAGARPMRSTSRPFCRNFSLCRGRRQRGFFRSALDNCERLIRTHACTSISAEPGDRPVWPVGYGFFEQGCCHTQRGFTFHRRRPRRGAGPAHQHRHAQSRGTPGERCLHARKTPRRCADWSNPKA